jgi:CheY-like chemotaxis protein
MGQKQTILYIDDELFFMQGVLDYLSQYYNVVSFPSGDAALEYLKESDSKPSLIVVDIMMQNGLRVRTADHGRSAGLEFSRIVSQEVDKDIPIICYTVVTDPALNDELLQIGVKQIVPKRRLPADLKAEIDQYILPLDAK